MLVINGVKANLQDIRTLNKLKRLKKIDIIFFKKSKNFINIVTN